MNQSRRRRNYVPGPTINRKAVRYFVYRLEDGEGVPVYIGRSCDVAKRIRTHRSGGKAWWLQDVRAVSMVGPLIWDDAVDLERADIARFQPRGNIALTARDHRPGLAWRSRNGAVG